MPAERKVFMSFFEKIRRKVENVKNFLTGLPILVLGGIIALAFIVVIVILIMAINGLEKQESAQTVETTVVETESDTETTESAETVESNESAEAETAQSSDSEQVLLSGIHIFFDGAWIQTYSREEAFNSEAVNLGQFSNDPSSILVQALISYNQPVSRIRVWVENESGGSISDEYFLYSENNWSTEMDLSSITGTVIVAISVADTNVPANNTYEYFKLFIPETSEEATEETEQAATQAEGNNANASGTQIFLNGVSVTGYASFEEAIQNPVNMAAGDVTIYAGNKPQSTSRILVQVGNDSKNAVAIDISPLSESNNWTQTVNVTEFQGSMLVFNITSELGFAAETANQFVAVYLQ